MHGQWIFIMYCHAVFFSFRVSASCPDLITVVVTSFLLSLIYYCASFHHYNIINLVQSASYNMVFIRSSVEKKKKKMTFTKIGENSFYEKKKKEAKINKYRKSKMLHQYSKLCVKEGLEYSNRVHLKRKRREHEENETAPKTCEKKHKPDPFKAAVEVANRRKQEAMDRDVAQKNKEKEIAVAKLKRNTLRNKMRQCNSKGQPLMKHQILHLLEKAKSSA